MTTLFVVLLVVLLAVPVVMAVYASVLLFRVMKRAGDVGLSLRDVVEPPEHRSP